MKILTIFLSMGWLFSQQIEVKKIELKYVKRTEIQSIVGEDVKVPRLKKWNRDDFIVVEVYSDTDLLKIARHEKTLLSADVHFCEKANDSNSLSLPGIYFSGQSLLNHSLNNNSAVEQDKLRDNIKLYKYDIVLFVAWDKDSEMPLSQTQSEKNSSRHNLRKSPEDICLSIKGAHMFIPALKSKEIRLTKADLRRVIKN